MYFLPDFGRQLQFRTTRCPYKKFFRLSLKVSKFYCHCILAPPPTSLAATSFCSPLCRVGCHAEWNPPSRLRGRWQLYRLTDAAYSLRALTSCRLPHQKAAFRCVETAHKHRFFEPWAQPMVQKRTDGLFGHLSFSLITIWLGASDQSALFFSSRSISTTISASSSQVPSS